MSRPRSSSAPRERARKPAAPKRGRPFGAGVAQQTREAIIRAAIARFARSGYARTAIQDIAREAGITSGSLYHHFDSKAAIWQAAVAHATLTLAEAYRTAAAEAPQASTVEQLGRGLERVIAVAREWPGIVRFAGGSAAEIRHHPDLEWLDEEVATAIPRFFRGLMQQARERGELAAEVSVDAAAGLLVVMVSGLSVSHEPDAEADDFIAHMRTFQRLLRGMLFTPRDGRRANINE